MANESRTSQDDAQMVHEAAQHVFEAGSMRSAVIEHGGATIVVTKGRRLGNDPEPAESPAEYPTVRTTLKDDGDSWLR